MTHDPAALARLALWAGQHAQVLFVALVALALMATCACWWAVQRFSAFRREGAGAQASGGFIAVRIAIGSGVALVSVLIFAALAGQFGGLAELRHADQVLTDALRDSFPLSAMRLFASLTHLADTRTLTVLCLGVAILLLIVRRPWLALVWVLAVGGNGLINTSLKHAFGRLRPLQPEGFVIERGFSFPSGHSSGCVVAYGMLACLAVRLLPIRWQLPSVLAAVVLVCTVGASRVFLRVHFASDVIAGFASGLAWLTLCIMGVELARWWGERRTTPTTTAAPGALR